MSYDLNKLYRVVPTKNANAIVFSKLSGIDFKGKSSLATGIKFVLAGREDYIVDAHHRQVGAGQFIIVNAGQQFAATIPGNQVAIGLCIDIDTNIISEVHDVLNKRQDKLLENANTSIKPVHNFFEEPRSVNTSGFAKDLTTLTRRLNDNQTVLPAEDFFYELAFKLLKDDQQVEPNRDRINTKKLSTKEELYRRLGIAKEILDDSVFADINLDDLAAATSLSKFHLLRLFKTVYRISPYQYQVKRRMEYAAMLLKTGKRSVQEISFMLNYADQQAFSKLFKKHFGKSPIEFRKG